MATVVKSVSIRGVTVSMTRVEPPSGAAYYVVSVVQAPPVPNRVMTYLDAAEAERLYTAATSA